MPRQFTAYEPDAVDCQTMVNAIGHDWGLLCEITVAYTVEKVTVVCKCRKIGDGSDGAVQVQALASCPLKQAKSAYVLSYSVLLDCWHQCDRGVLAVKEKPIARGWSGRPQQPRVARIAQTLQRDFTEDLPL